MLKRLANAVIDAATAVYTTVASGFTANIDETGSADFCPTEPKRRRIEQCSTDQNSISGKILKLLGQLQQNLFIVLCNFYVIIIVLDYVILANQQ